MTAESLVRAEMVVEGDVQGVGFRYFVRRAARRLGVKGFVENLETGAVKVVAEASKERVEKLIERIKSAPPPIAVDEITVTYGKPTGEFKTFKIVVKDLAEEMVEGFATGASYFEIMFEKQDKALVKLDTLIEKQDLMLAKQDQMLQKQDLMLEKQDQMLGKMDLMLEKQDLMLQKQDQMLLKQDQMLQKQDEMVERQDVLVDEVKGLRRDVSSLMEDRIARIERDVAMIKARLGITG
ncbi:MAG: acylphosphatase [Candidatus Caldarchaeum sp.]